jgi:hypothetical protein
MNADERRLKPSSAFIGVYRRPFIFFLLLFTASAETPFTHTPAHEAALDRISADSLRGHLSFIASDLLAGRDTPSPGLDIAAEYIAAQFRRAGLEPAGDDGYFQTARYVLTQPKPESFSFTLETPAGPVTVGTEAVAAMTACGFDFAAAPVVKFGATDVAGKVVLVEGRLSGAQLRKLSAARPALILVLDRENKLVPRFRPNLIDPVETAAPWIFLHSPALAKAADAGLQGVTVTAKLQPARPAPVKLRNVIGLLRGSDPALRDTYILLTAHYDHVGVVPNCTKGDCIFNGANDDASGAVCVIEIAAALARLEPRPKRSIVFLALFGEEKGSYGARWYTRHPVFPLAKTIANVNLEQLGVPDTPAAATFTGFEYSSLPRAFVKAGQLTGVNVHNTSDSNAYFDRSDNIAFARAGIPAHTLCAAYTYPDYHGVGDSWDKIDYPNMARIARMTALGLVMLAEDPVPPRYWVTISF